MSLGAAPAPQPAPALKIERSSVTGLATFVTAPGGGAIGVQPAVAGGRIQPMDFLTAQGHLFGVRDAARELVQSRAEVDQMGHIHTSYQQWHKGVPVFSGVLKVHQAGDGSILAGNGDFYPIADRLDTNPHLTADAAAVRAHAELGLGQPKIEHSELVIVDPGWYGDPPTGVHLAYYIILSDMAVPFREAFFVDAHRGRILDQWNLLETSRFREVTDDTTSTVVRSEGDPPTGDFDADSAYDYSGDWYDYFSRGFGRDSYDDAGSNLTNVVHLVSSGCPNAFGGGGASFFCNGTATDDIVAHEWGHSLTSQTSNLIYQNQAGQLNESYSDIWGEMIDLFNGDASFAGPPGGTSWPTDPTYVGPGTDTPNTLRTGCVSGTFMAVNSPMSIAGDYLAQAASFGPPLTPTGTSGNIVVADPVRGCIADLPFSNEIDMAGKIVLMDRGTCFFTEKVKNAQDAGAIAAIIANNVPGGPAPMGGGDPSITIPSVGITQADGVTIKTAAQSSKVNVTLRTNSSPDVRWLVSEDSTGFGGAIRDMWQPSCSFDPDHANHPFQTCSPTDNGGVHSGSGIPNHAFAMLVDGKTFNGQTVSAIGPIKAAAVWYRAGAVYLTPASNFQDAYTALNQAATDLIGTNIVDPRDGVSTVLFTAADAVEVDDALRAVEMNTEGLCGSWKNVLDSDPVAKCPNRTTLYADDFEMGVNGWAVANSGPFGPPTPYDWFQISGGLPFGWPGSVWHIEDRDIGDCDTVDESAVHTLTSPVIVLPATLFSPTLAFTHYLDAETFIDGGNVKISVNNGPFLLIPKSAFLHNEYNDRLSAGTNTNPMAGQEAWTGSSMDGGQWGTSLIDLSGFVSGGENVQFRFDFGKDGCAGTLGWYVDDFEAYTCPTCGNEVLDPGEVCDPPGAPVCPGGAACLPDCTCDAGPANDIVWVPTKACINAGSNLSKACTDDAECGLCSLKKCSGLPANTTCTGMGQGTCTARQCSGLPAGTNCTGTGQGTCPVGQSCNPSTQTCDFIYCDTTEDQCTPVSAGTCTAGPAGSCVAWPNISSLATTRSLRFTVTGPAGPSKPEAIKVTMVDLHHPIPANLPAQPPPNFTSYDTRLNGVCTGGAIPGHHCDTNADCLGGGTCSSLAVCTAAGEANGCARWVGKLGTFYEAQGPPVSGPYKAARLQCTPYYWDWKPEGLITAVGADIAPSSEYSVQLYGASCTGAESGCTNVSAPVTMYTRRSGDVEVPFNPPSTSGQPDVTDIAQLVNKFKNLTGAPVKAIAQLQPNLPELNADLNAIDIVAVVDSVKGIKYAFSGPCACPSLVTCGATACPSGATVCVNTYGPGSLCVRTCNGGANAGDPCINYTHCPGGNCGKVCVGGTNDGLGCDLAGHCPKSCVGGSNPGAPCLTGTECLDGGTCPSTTCVASTPNAFCRDRCGRCKP